MQKFKDFFANCDTLQKLYSENRPFIERPVLLMLPEALFVY